MVKLLFQYSVLACKEEEILSIDLVLELLVSENESSYNIIVQQSDFFAERSDQSQKI